MATDPASFGWLDAARFPQDDDERELRVIAQLWALGHGIEIDDTIHDDLAPFPDLEPDTARLLLRDKVNAFLDERQPVPHVVNALEDGLRMTVTFQDRITGISGKALDGWREFLLMYTGWRHVGKSVQACAHCGKTYMPERRGGTYCSTNCRVAAHTQRKQEAQT